MNILNTIRERRSIHTFKDQEVNTELLEEIFTYGSYAPTHYMTEPWKIKIYQEGGKTAFVDAILASYQRIGMLKMDGSPKSVKMNDSMKKFLLEIPHHAVIYFEKKEDLIRYEEEYASVCAFIQNVQLAGWEHGVGMLWTITPYMHDPQFLKDIGLNNEKVKIAAVMQLGYPDRVPKDKGRSPIQDKLEIITD
ncbi:nitroreductase [Virgibacillus sp. C22-A2]|uniref:Nitroreductase n=1 Tax=Virgibacillus tibetensis TaxID=3042313 RepID=A0ABU6KJI8_9BACI|nr:nitroreductase [Virgibacillus sp. C22-A2]